MSEAREPQTFEQALAELERIVRDLEDGRTGLEESLARYEQGVALLKRCYSHLNHAEQRISELAGTDAAGNSVGISTQIQMNQDREICCLSKNCKNVSSSIPATHTFKMSPIAVQNSSRRA